MKPKVLGIIGCKLPAVPNAMKKKMRDDLLNRTHEFINLHEPDDVMITMDKETGPWLAHALRDYWKLPYTAVVCEKTHYRPKVNYWKNQANHIIKASIDGFAEDLDGLILAEYKEQFRDAHKRQLTAMTMRASHYAAPILKILKHATSLIIVKARHHVGLTEWTWNKARAAGFSMQNDNFRSIDLTVCTAGASEKLHQKWLETKKFGKKKQKKYNGMKGLPMSTNAVDDDMLPF